MPMELPKKAGLDTMENIKVVDLRGQSPINFMDGLALLFIGLKLTGHLDEWTWIEILAPLWGPFMLMWFVRLVVHTFFGPDEDEDEDEE